MSSNSAAEGSKRMMLVWVGALIQNVDRFLLLRRGKSTKNWQKKWQLPGGKMEWGEAPLKTMKREVMEETGLTVKSPELCGTYTTLIKNGNATTYHILMVVYHAKTERTNVRLSDEHDEFRWVTLKEAARMELLKDLGSFIRDFSRGDGP